MNNLHKIKLWLPEIYLFISVIYYWTLTNNVFNPFAIGFLIVLLALMKFKWRWLGLTIGILLALVNVYLLLGLFSELNEFTEINAAYYRLLGFGLAYIILNITLAMMMIFKWAIQTSSPGANDGGIPESVANIHP